MTLSITTLRIMPLSTEPCYSGVPFMRNVTYVECHFYTECRYAECHYAECRYAECCLF